MPVVLEGRQPGMTIPEVDQLEKSLGFRLPAAYADFLRTFNGATPRPNVFDAKGFKGSVTSFLGRASAPLDDLQSTIQAYTGRLPDRVIPVALAAGGNLIVLELDTGRTYAWDHEREAQDGEMPSHANLHWAAESFDDFLKALHPFDPEDIKLDPANVVSVKVKPGFLEKFKDQLSR